MADADFVFKIILIGDAGVGKSSLIKRYTDGQFATETYATLGVDFKMKTLVVDESKIKLQIWDTAGQERYKCISSSYYKGAHAAIVVYDIIDMESYEKAVNTLIPEIKNEAKEDALIFLVGNKCDLENQRKVKKIDAENVAMEYGYKFFETSAKTAYNVNETFFEMAKRLKRCALNEDINQSIKLTSQNHQEQKSLRKTYCCYYI